MSIPNIIVIPKYQEGTHEGGIQTSEYYSIMEKVAKENYKKWGYNNEDEALIHLLNATDYDYRGYYNKYPESRANADTHWTDEFKTVYHPTFSKDSIYSGKKSQFNPRGTIGGRWDGLEYRPSYSQVFNNDFDFNKTNLYLRNSGNREYIDRYYQDIYDRAKELEKRNGAVTLDGPPSYTKLNTNRDYKRFWNAITGRYFKSGGSIKIKKKNKGKFTESAKRAGKSVQEHARDVVNDPKATKLQKRRAQFALNAKKFKHQNGGCINYLNLF